MAADPHIRRTQVFLSYSRSDRDLAEEINISLETYGFEVVYDQEDIASGEPWEPRLTSLINEADTTVCLISQSWIASSQCAKELSIALDRGRRVLPVIIDAIDPSSLREELASLQFIFLHGEGRSYARGIAELIAALNTDIEWVREQSRLLGLASDWVKSGKSEALRLRGEALNIAKAWQAKDVPRDVKILPLVSEFIGFSEECEISDQRQRLRGRIRIILLAAVAVIGVLGSVMTYALLAWERATNEALYAENLAFANAIGATGCDQSCSVPTESRAPEAVYRPAAPLPAPPVASGAPSPEVIEDTPKATTNADLQRAARLVANLNSSDRTTRLQAGQEVANALRGQDEAAVLQALVEQLDRPNRDSLSATGRFNVLYMLNLSDGWDEAGVRDDLAAALDDIAAREKGGVAVGSQTYDCIQKIEQRLNGDDTVSRRCGGR